MKKEWSKPEVTSLGVENTADDISAFGVKPTYKGRVQCGYCNVIFPNVAAYESHKTRDLGDVGVECTGAPNLNNEVEDWAIPLGVS